MPAASYLMTYREGPGRRRALLAVLSRLARCRDLEIVIVEQDSAPRLTAVQLPGNARLVFGFNPGLFNKSWGMNAAARNSRSDVIAIADADLILSYRDLSEGISACRNRFHAVNPYGHLVDLSMAETEAYATGRLALSGLSRERFDSRKNADEHAPFCGGICIFRRDVFFALGGMDESFEGWGQEDNALTVNLLQYTKNIGGNPHAVAYHLWHRRALAVRTRGRTASYVRNSARLQEVRKWSESEWRAFREANRAIMGNIPRTIAGADCGRPAP